ncbi:MAG: hypothetical protein KJO09_01930 [Gammaproteobacteria bacterium]|nr:hypothetical protein [Gammaproteobacteria bacterium]
MTIRALPLVAGIVPVAGVSLSYWIGMNSGILPVCMPFLDGCVSISATGRYLPASLLFHAIMLPQSVLLVFLWYFTAQWLRAIAPDTRAAGAVIAAGMLGALSLILYVTFLGTKAPFYEFMRRFGIYLYFLGTAISQLTLAIALFGHARRSGALRLKRIATGMLWFCGLPFALGILNLILKATLEDADPSENRIEWISALSMQAYFVLIYVAWRDTGFRVAVRTA